MSRGVYIATDHVGLYEKYGYTYLENRIDCRGSDQRVLYRDIRLVGADQSASSSRASM